MSGGEQHWKVRKGVDHLKAGDLFKFSEEFGGEGEVVTAEGPATNLMGTRVVNVKELDFPLEFNGNAWVDIAVDREARYGLTDDITTCPRCGSRTDYVDEPGSPDGEQEHACINAACRYVFVGFFDPEDFDKDGNFIDSPEEISDTSDIGERDFEETPGNAADFEHLDQGMTVTLIKEEVTWEPGDDSQAEVRLPAGTNANVIDWVEEWFHVHVRTHDGQHAWVCPDNLKEKKA